MRPVFTTVKSGWLKGAVKMRLQIPKPCSRCGKIIKKGAFGYLGMGMFEEYIYHKQCYGTQYNIK